MRCCGVWVRYGLVMLVALLVACASTPRTASVSASAHWQGKLALKVFSQPVQSLSANFELQGYPEQGELTLSSPLGTTMARLVWAPGIATLQANGELRHFDSLRDLALKVTGTELPVGNLFAWLAGRTDPAPGWEVHLQDLPQGRLQANRIEAVRAELRIILEQ